jgi:hypothetical protein
MSRNQLKSFPTAILRRGMAHFHPQSPKSVTNRVDGPAVDRPDASVEESEPVAVPSTYSEST